MNISTPITTPLKISLGNQLASSKRTQNIPEVVQKINDITDEVAAKRKSIAAEQLNALREKLRIMLMFSSLDNKNNAATAAQIAKEIAGAVNDYANASGDHGQAQGLSQQDQQFLNTAKQLAAQVKAIIVSETEKARRKHQTPESHHAIVSTMDAAIEHLSHTLGLDSSPLYTFDGSQITLLA